MLRSMTGYGEASTETPEFVLGVEVKTVNNRFLKLSSKIPEEVAYLQARLEEVIRRRLVRGSVFFVIRFEPLHPEDLYEIDEPLVEKYFRTLAKLSEKLGAAQEIRLAELCQLPGAVRTEEALVLGRDKVEPVAYETLDAALDRVVAMRECEGGNLREELESRAKRLMELLAEVRATAPKAVEEHFERLDQKIRRLLGDQQAALTAEDVLKEAAILAERSDISEEIARMDSHLQQFGATLNSGGPVGRKLEFIVQEMFRESNTMGAKAPNSGLNQSVVEMKAEVDRLKEQVLNIE